MSVVLAVEPDSAQAEALRKALRRLDAELLLVSTTRAAISAMGKSVPDLILVSTLLSPRDEDALFVHLRSLDDSSHIQTLTIPQLRRGKASAKTASLGRFRKKTAAPAPAGCDPAVFAEQVSGYLARAHEAKRQFAEMALARPSDPVEPIRQPIPRAGHELRVGSAQPIVPALPVSVFDLPVREAPVLEEPGFVAIEQTEALGRLLDEEAARRRAAEAGSVLLPDPVAPWRPQATPAVEQSAFGGGDSLLKPEPTVDEVAAWRTPLERFSVEQPAAQLKDDAWIDLDVDDLAEQLDPERLEVPLTVEEVQSQMSAEIARFEEKAQQRREVELVRAQAEAQARLTAEVERVQAEAETRRQLELARVHAEAEAQRHAAVTEARAAAESEARNALRAELEQVRLNEVARVQAEADQRCDVAAREARETAQAEAARAMAEELARIRSQVEQTLNTQLAQARLEAEEIREVEMAQAQAEAATQRDSAAREARLAAEAAASRALEAEVARVRVDAEARLQVELETIRREAEHLRRADRSEATQAAERVHAAAVRDARAIAEAANQTLEAELLRVRAEADARLEAEVDRARDQAERQRATELEEIRTQVAEMRETASQQARRAAAQAIASEVVRGADEGHVEPVALTPAIRPVTTRPATTRPAVVEPQKPAVTTRPVESPKPAVTARSVEPPKPAAGSATDYYSLWKPSGAPAAELPPAGDNTDTPKTFVALIRSKWALPVAAAILLVVGNGMSVGWSWRSRPSPEPAHVVVPVHRAAAPIASELTAKTGELDVETDPPGVRVLLDGVAAGHSPLTISKVKPGKHTLVLESGTGTLTRKVVVRAGETAHVAEGIFSGWLTVFAAIPLNIYVGGQLRGTTEDGQLMLSAGPHNVVLVSERFNYREARNVTIEPGTIVSFTVSLPTSMIRIKGPDGTDISIDGHAAGRTPLGDVPVPIGTHEVVATSAELGQVRQSIEVKLGEPAEVTLK